MVSYLLSLTLLLIWDLFDSAQMLMFIPKVLFCYYTRTLLFHSLLLGVLDILTRSYYPLC